jgi:Domain of unknown function (DUF4263)
MKKKIVFRALKTAKYVRVTAKSYGHFLRGTKIFYEGARPKNLHDDGRINFGKNILELLQPTFRRFRWIITKKKDEIKKVNGIFEIRTSQKTLGYMNSLSFARTRDIKIDIIKEAFSRVYPSKHFDFSVKTDFRPNSLSEILKPEIISKLSEQDKDALNTFLPEYISRESVSAVNFLKASTQIRTLKELAKEIRDEIGGNRSEGWWQKFIHKNILFIQQGYINAIAKMNISIGTIKFPDFSLVTHDDFLDIFEIKKPSTTLLKFDDSRNNYYWDTEISKAISQVENYIENVSKNAEAVRGYIKDAYKIDLKVVRPRGIILAGCSNNLSDQKQKDDFRLLTLASKNITFVTYDELATRLENYINVLEKHSKKIKK